MLTKQLILNVSRTQFMAEGEALVEMRDFFCIVTHESILDQWLEG